MKTTKRIAGRGRISADELIRPMKMTCAKCGNPDFVMFPAPGITGAGYCPTCSPAWLKRFAQFSTNRERERLGLEKLQFAD